MQNSYSFVFLQQLKSNDIFSLGQKINRDTQSPLSVTIKAPRLEFSQFLLHCSTWISECDLPLGKYFPSETSMLGVSDCWMDFCWEKYFSKRNLQLVNLVSDSFVMTSSCHKIFSLLHSHKDSYLFHCLSN